MTILNKAQYMDSRGVVAHCKKVRLPGTEDMDKEYVSNNGKHFWGEIK